MAQQNKTILISGGASGIGKAAALRFLEKGWNASVFSNLAEHNREFEQTAKMQGYKNFLVTHADMTGEASLKKVVQATYKKFKTVDVLYNNAGIGYFETAEKVEAKKLDRLLEINVIGMAVLTKQVLPIMKRQKHGQIINMSSIAAKVVHAKSEFYALSKAAVLEYSEGLRQEQKKNRIKVATICPGMVETGFWNKKEIARRKREVWGGKMPARLAVEDIVRVVEFIVDQSERSDIQDVTIMPL